MSLPFLNTAPGYDEELRNSVFFERRLHATSICGEVGAAVAVAMLQGVARGGDRLRRLHRGQHRRRPAGGQPHRRDRQSGSTAAGPRAAAWQRPTWPGTGSPARRQCWRAASGSCRRSAAQPLHPRGRGRRRPRRPGARPADVTAIELGVAKPVLRTIAEPPEAKARPASGYHAAFSGHYTVAAALLGGGPGNPRSDEKLARKFHDNAVRSLPEERAAEVAGRTLALPDAQSVEDLTALLTSAGER